MYVVKRVTLNSPFNSQPQTVVRHSRHDQLLNGIRCLVRLKLEKRIDMDHLALGARGYLPRGYIVSSL